MTTFDFGYSWVWTHGHLVPFGLFGLLATAAIWRGWARWIAVVAGTLAVWAFAGFLITQVVIGPNRPVPLPTEAFLRRGTGEVLDAGAGSGRSSLMVLLARPRAHVTALDIYRGYYGIDDNTPDRIRANARAGGVEARLDVVTGDMRAMPIADGHFDAAVSAFAIDHLDREGVSEALAEIARVVRPGGEFLLMIVNVDGWLRLAYPFPHGHGYFSTPQDIDRWRDSLRDAGFDMIEEGTRPATRYFLAHRR